MSCIGKITCMGLHVCVCTIVRICVSVYICVSEYSNPWPKCCSLRECTVYTIFVLVCSYSSHICQFTSVTFGTRGDETMFMTYEGTGPQKWTSSVSKGQVIKSKVLNLCSIFDWGCICSWNRSCQAALLQQLTLQVGYKGYWRSWQGFVAGCT